MKQRCSFMGGKKTNRNLPNFVQISREKSRAPAPMDDEDDGFKLVKVNTKNSKNKRRQRKLQKADPSLLGMYPKAGGWPS